MKLTEMVKMFGGSGSLPQQLPLPFCIKTLEGVSDAADRMNIVYEWVVTGSIDKTTFRSIVRFL